MAFKHKSTMLQAVCDHIASVPTEPMEADDGLWMHAKQHHSFQSIANVQHAECTLPEI